MKKVAVITGGAGGMGLATAKIVGKDQFVVICDVNQERLNTAKTELTKLGIESETVTCDITDKKSVNELVKRAGSYGVVTSVIHTAGVSPSMGSYELIAKINAVGTINVNRAFLKIAHPGFAIVNVASMAGYLFPKILLPKRSYRYALKGSDLFLKKILRPIKFFPKKLRSGVAYSISKNFVIWFSQATAAEFGAKGARILSVSPGSFETSMGKLEKDHGAGAMADISALKRFGQPNEIAELLAFCASDKSSYLTGTDILCDGGTVAGMKINGKKAKLG
jgi:NAD(P)-dependent dehydrogenase (short-subunit alcohol dehydrogenase family)